MSGVSHSGLGSSLLRADAAMTETIANLRRILKLKSNQMPPPELVAAYLQFVALHDLGNAVEAVAQALAER